MIGLFNIATHKIDTAQFSNLLHDPIVQEFEGAFADYVGAKYACSTNSETSAIFLVLVGMKTKVTVPSIIPPVVLNSVLHGGNTVQFSDDVDWVGDSYVLHRFSNCKLIDSAQKVSRNQFATEAADKDMMLFSFYPTKPVGGSDGGMIVSNDKEKIDQFRIAVMNGTTFNSDNWEREIVVAGWKMYMNSIQAQIAYSNLKTLDWKKEKLEAVRYKYNKALGCTNTSDHLYRVTVKDADDFRRRMREDGIVCGKHYAAMHRNSVYAMYATGQIFPDSERVEKTTVSLPFHEALSDADLDHVIDKVRQHGEA